MNRDLKTKTHIFGLYDEEPQKYRLKSKPEDVDELPRKSDEMLEDDI